MTVERWALLTVAAVLLIVSVVLAVQGSAGLWFTAVGMGITIFAILRLGLKERRQNPGSSDANS